MNEWLLCHVMHLQLKGPLCDIMGVADAEVRHDRMPNPINRTQYRLYNGLSSVRTVYLEVRSLRTWSHACMGHVRAHGQLLP